MTNPLLKGNTATWLLVGAVAFAMLILLVGSAGGGGVFGPAQPQGQLYMVKAEVPVSITLSGLVTGDRWVIRDLQNLVIAKEVSRFPFFLGLGILNTGEVTVEGCIDGRCQTAELGSLSKLGEDRVAALEFHGVTAGDKLLDVTLKEGRVVRARKSFNIAVG